MIWSTRKPTAATAWTGQPAAPPSRRHPLADDRRQDDDALHDEHALRRDAVQVEDLGRPVEQAEQEGGPGDAQGVAAAEDGHGDPGEPQPGGEIAAVAERGAEE